MVTLDEGGWAAADTRLEKPPARLGAVVEHVFTVDFRGAEQRTWKILPDTCGHVIVTLGVGVRRRPVTVVGARTRAITTDVRGRGWTVGVRLRPGALSGLVAAPADRLTDRSATPGAIWGASGDRLEGELLGVDDPEHARARLLDFLRRRSASVPRPDWRAEAFATLSRRSGGRMEVGAAAQAIGVSPRALRDVAHAALGLAPKRYARIDRLFQALEVARSASWSRVAARTGFSDQAHLIRDVQDLLGERPTEFSARGRPAPIPSRQRPPTTPG